MGTSPTTVDAARWAVLRDYRPDTDEVDPVLAAIADRAAELCGTLVAAVCFPDSEHRDLSARFGVELPATTPDTSLCRHIMDAGDVLVIPDAGRDPRVAGHPLVAGERRVRFVAGAPLVTAHGHVLGALCLFDERPQDLGPIRTEGLRVMAEQVVAHLETARAQRLLDEVNRRGQGADQIKDEFLAMISHEVRTPVASMTGYLELLRDEADGLSDRALGWLDRLDRSARRMVSLVDQLLLAAASAAARPLLATQRVDLAEAVAEAVTVISPAADRARVPVTVLADGPVTVLADPQRLHDMIVQLLSNAVTFTPAGGSVEVRVHTADGGGIDITDTGIGVPEHELPYLFDRFYRGAHAQHNAMPGSGLGLTTARAIAEAHGAHLELTSQPGRGTTVRVRFPAVVPVPAPPAATAGPGAAAESAAAPGPVATTEVPGDWDRLTDELLAGARDYAILMLDPDGTIVTWSASARQLFGYRQEEVLGQPYSRLFTAADTAAGLPRHFLGVAVEGGRADTEGFRVRRDGSQMWVSGSVSALHNTDGTIRGFVTVAHDATRRYHAEQAVAKLNSQLYAKNAELERVSRTDPLTGLHNRRHLQEQLRGLESMSRRHGGDLSALLIDVDHFKRINDRYGHDAGDRVLCTVAGLLRETVRQEDVLARWGGEEFLILAPYTDETGALLFGERVRSAIAADALPVSDTVGVTITVSVGVATGVTAGGEDLIRRADAALYHAKAAGRDRVALDGG